MRVAPKSVVSNRWHEFVDHDWTMILEANLGTGAGRGILFLGPNPDRVINELQRFL
jgi:hypothetical protein